MISHSRQQMLAEIAAGRTGDGCFRGIKKGSEDEIQANFFAWVDLHKERFPKLKLFYAIPNGANKSKMQRYVMQLTGTRLGVPDTHLPVARWQSGAIRHYSLWIEFKRPGQYATKEQREWIERLRDEGHRAEVCTSWVDAANITIEHLGLPLEKI